MKTSISKEGTMIRTAPVPGFEVGKQTPGLTGGQSLGIRANSKNKQAAWRLIEYFIFPEAQLRWAKRAVLPIRKSVYNDPYFQTPQGRELIQWRDYIEKHGRIGRDPGRLRQALRTAGPGRSGHRAAQCSA
jgi:ABC-type glycerol-3-phosphate transport system substrate-binding protein